MATHSSTLAWEIPRTEESGGLLSLGLQRVRQDLESKQQQQKGNIYLESYHHQVAFWSLILFL